MATWEPGVEFGRYVLESQLGAGGMGEVWKARDQRLGRTVALKRLLGEHNARFEQEARAIAALNHPHICQIYDVGQDYLVLEYVDGSPLKGPLPVEHAVPLAIQVATALEEAHRQGILHRDLKPGNILVTTQHSVKLLDFGLAKLLKRADQVSNDDDTATRTGTVMGTVAYMSPEQAQGAALDERSDIFSFGAVFYELLSGNRAFEGASMAQILSAVLRDHPRPLNVAEPIARIVTRCLHKNPNDRFQTVADLRAALQQQLTPSAQTQLPQLAVSQSIAVLPFANIGADPENEYFSDGLAEEIINLLAHANDIRVIARTSAFAFKGQNTDIRRIAQTLGVTHVLEGGVRRAGGRVRITAQLISAADGSQIWSERYDRVLEDIFEVQDEIGQAIAGALHAKLSINSDSSNAVCRYEPNLPAYEAYLKGRHHASSTFTPESIELAQRHYQLALELDPQMALAHAGLAVLALMRAMLNVLPAHDAMRVVRSSARRALEIDPSLSEAHAILGVVAALYDYDWREAEHRFGMAMKPGPLSPVARGYYGYFYLMSLGRMPQAVEQLTIALKADPLNIQLRYQRAVTLLWNEQDEEAIAQLQQVLELHNQFPMAMTMMALAVVHSSQQKNTREALAWTQKGFPEVTAQLLPAAIQAGLFMRLGEPMNAQPFLDHLGDGHHYGAPAALAVYHLICGDTDQSANWIEKAIEERYPGVLFILQSPLAADLRTSPRWTGLVERMNLPQGDANSSRRNATS